MASKPTTDPSVEIDRGDGAGFQPTAPTDDMSQLSLHNDNGGSNDEEEDDDDLEEDDENDLSQLPKKVQVRIEALRKIQDKQAVLEIEYEKERRLLDLKYEKLYQPFYQQRADIVQGIVEVEAIEGDPEDENEEEQNVKGIPGFWLRAFMNNSLLSELIQERDLPAFEYLLDVHSSSHENDNGFKLSFEFAENPYFTNTTLTKEYDLGEASESGEAVLLNVIGTTIDWKDGKNLCVITKRVKQKAKGNGNRKGETRVVTKTEPCESFFHFFTPSELPKDENDENDEERDLVMRQFQQDFEIGFRIHETIIPRALLWFTGEIMDQDDSDYDPEEDDEDDSDESDDESDDNEESGQKYKAKGGKKSKHGALKEGGEGGEKAPECKNQ